MSRMSVLAVLLCFAAMTGQADTMVNVTSLAGQSANDTAKWSQLGADQTLLTASFGATSTGGLGITVSLAGPNSIVSVDCVATPCSWAGGPSLTAGDSLIWTSDNGNSGNGPVTFTFAQPVSGAGAFVQANAPGQFTVQIQAFNGATLLGTFSETSDPTGDAMYIGLQDATGANITSVTISLTACGPLDTSGCTDFAVDALNLNDTTSAKQATTSTVITSLNPSTFQQSVTFTATVSPATSGTPTGTATFMDGAATLGTGALSGGVATFATAALAIGSHSITAIYGGDSNFLGSTSPALTQTVNKEGTTTAVVSSLNPSNFGQSTTFTATVTPAVSGTPTGSVTFKNGTTTLATKTLSGGSTTFSTSTLAPGTLSITVVYGGDTNFTGSTSAILAQIVNKDATTTSAITSSLNPSTYGQPVTYSATVTFTFGAPTGSVTFKDGTTTLGSAAVNSSGVASITTTKTSVGARSITAVYGGSTDNAGSTSPVFAQTVNQDATTTSAVTSSLNPSTYGQSVTYSATVTSATGVIPSGAVAFKDGTSILGNVSLNSAGVATFTTTKTSAGARSITAAYAGTVNFTGSTSPILSQTVNQDATTTSAVTSTLNPSTYGQSVTYLATVTSATGVIPIGSLTFKDGTTSLGSVGLNALGVANLTTTKTSAGTRSITAVYAGTTNFTASTSPVLTQIVNQVSTTTSAIGSSLNPSTYGQAVTYSVTVTSATAAVPVGTVTFKNSAATLGTANVNSSGVAAFTTKTTPAGTDTITAAYAGNANFIGSSAPAALTQIVSQVSTTTSAITSSLNPSTYGQSVTYSATVTSATPVIPSGAVVFKNGVATLGSVGLNSSGVANFTTTSTPAGTDSITAAYMGNSNFIGSTSPAFSQTVSPAGSTTAVTSSLNPSTFGTSVTFTATVTPAISGTPTGNVTFMDGATSLGTRSLGNGKATLALTTLSKGSHTITAVYAGSTNFTGSASPPLTQTVN